MMLTLLEQIALVLMTIAVLLSMTRLILGPTAPDRIISADTLSVLATVTLVGFALLFDSALYLDVALIYSTLAFVGVVALARTIEGGRT
ncbi:MAG: cation:proton antiporter [Gammaproteobacteria bacterium]|nr:cation:proton antiporter [Gammaproteobacteria bacterium]